MTYGCVQETAHSLSFLLSLPPSLFLEIFILTNSFYRDTATERQTAWMAKSNCIIMHFIIHSTDMTTFVMNL